MRNLWQENAPALAEAYSKNAGPVRFELVTKALILHMPSMPQRIVDVGGGFGLQAIMLARIGHFVSVIDSDSNMLAIAEQKLMNEEREVASRVKLFFADGNVEAEFFEMDFDVACCHSVLMYQDDPVPMLQRLVRMVKKSGLISILSLNTDAIAMRTGLQGRWNEVKEILKTGKQCDGQYLPTKEYSMKLVTDILESAGAKIITWYGVGVFTDHLDEKIRVADPEDVYSTEWLAGMKDPYRQVARCYHLIAQRC